MTNEPKTPEVGGELMPCPMCAGPADYVAVGGGYRVRCGHCLAESGWGDYGYQVEALWNRRVVSPPALQEEWEGHDLIERLLDAQQDINLAANETMRQSLADASALIDEIEPILRAALHPTPSPAIPEREEVVAMLREELKIAVSPQWHPRLAARIDSLLAKLEGKS